MRLVVLCGVWLLFAMVVPVRAAGPDESTWLINYAISEEIKTVSVTLIYAFWDPKVEGDAYTKKTLLTTTPVSLAAGQTTIPIQISLNGGRSVVIVGKQLFRGKGRLLDSSFVRATEPKVNFDGYYILEQKSVDPKNPVPMGQTGDAVAWVALEVDPKP